MAMRTDLPPALAEVASGRDYLTTREFARAVNKAEQTVRKLNCLTCEAYGVRAVKIGNRLLWPVAQIARLLSSTSGEVSK